MDYMSSIIEKIIVERNKKVDSAILGEIHQIAIENGIETRIIMNQKNIEDALRNYKEGYKTIKAEAATEILDELDGFIKQIRVYDFINMPITYYSRIIEFIDELRTKYTEGKG